MTVDDLKLLGAGSISKKDAGGSLYTVPGSTTAWIKKVVITNKSAVEALADVFFDVSTQSIFTGLIPPFKSEIIKMEVGLAAADQILARQSVSMEHSNINMSQAVAGIGSLTDATSYATASWSSVTDGIYLMNVWSSHGTAATEPTSFTDTHSGITWTKVQGGPSIGGLLRLTQYRAKASGVTNTTTTVTFGATQTGCVIQIIAITGADTTGSNAEEAIQGCGLYVPKTHEGAIFPVIGKKWAGSRILSAGQQAQGADPQVMVGFEEIMDTNNGEAIHAAVYLSRKGGISGGVSWNVTTNTQPINSMVSVQDATDAIHVSLHGIEMT